MYGSKSSPPGHSHSPLLARWWGAVMAPRVCSWKCFWGVRAFGVGQGGPRRGVRVKIHPSPNYPRLAILPSMRQCGEMVEGLT